LILTKSSNKKKVVIKNIMEANVKDFISKLEVLATIYGTEKIAFRWKFDEYLKKSAKQTSSLEHLDEFDHLLKAERAKYMAAIEIVDEVEKFFDKSIK
jgi:hypothetical protein